MISTTSTFSFEKVLMIHSKIQPHHHQTLKCRYYSYRSWNKLIVPEWVRQIMDYRKDESPRIKQDQDSLYTKWTINFKFKSLWGSRTVWILVDLSHWWSAHYNMLTEHHNILILETIIPNVSKFIWKITTIIWNRDRN